MILASLSSIYLYIKALLNDAKKQNCEIAMSLSKDYQISCGDNFMLWEWTCIFMWFQN